MKNTLSHNLEQINLTKDKLIDATVKCIKNDFVKIKIYVKDNFTFPVLLAHRKILRLKLKNKGFIK